MSQCCWTRAALRRRGILLCLILCVAVVFTGSLSSIFADIASTGDISPTAATSWTSSTEGYIGDTAGGTLTVNGGSSLTSFSGYVGYGNTATGVVNVSGSDSAWNVSNNLYLGYSGQATLSLTAGGSLASYYGYVGYDSAATGVVNISGSGSAWNVSDNLYLGYGGQGSLSVTAGGSVSASCEIGSLSGSSGTLTIDGSGSIWKGGLSVGDVGTGTLWITKGASVAGTGEIGSFAGSSGTAVVDGVGSTWNTDFLWVGNQGTGSLTISNGAVVNTSASGLIGYSYGSAGSVAVSGSGSTWNCTGGLDVGYSGGGTLTISNGARVTGSSEAAFNGFVSVDGAASALQGNGNLRVGGTLSITNGGVVSFAGSTYVGDLGTAAQISFDANGGSLTTQSILVSPSQLAGTGVIQTRGIVSDIDLCFDSPDSLRQTVVFQQTGQNVAVVFDLATNPSGNGALGAGWNGSGSLTIRNGITVKCSDGYLGYGSGATGAATVTGNGSTWCVGGNLYVGYSGNGTLSISNGGSVSVAQTTSVSVSSSGSASMIQFGDGGGTLSTLSLYISPSQLSGAGTINTRGIVSDLDLRFDATHPLKQTLDLSPSAGQAVAVNLDLGSDPSSNGDLGAGLRNAGSLTIQDGVKVVSASGWLGVGSNATGVATVSGTGSAWTIAGTLCVGNQGAGTLSIVRGGTVDCNSAAIGSTGTGVLSVDGIGSKWTCGYLTLGTGLGSVAMLSVTNGGTAATGSIYDFAQLSPTKVAVNVVGATWTNTGDLYFGGTISVAAGGTVSNSGGFVGSVLVDGIGSQWISSGSLNLGSVCAITNGGRLSDSDGVIGSSQYSSGAVTVSGAGSEWMNSGSMTVAGCLSVRNGGSVASSSGLTVAGSLSVRNGSRLACNGGTVSGYLHAIVAVDGANSVWSNSGNLFVGKLSDGGWVSITGGAAVTATNVSVYGGQSILAIDVGRGSSLTVDGDTGTLDESFYGIVRVLAGAGVPTDDVPYTPIVAKKWTGSCGMIQAIGGTWNASAHTFAASRVIGGTAGTPVSLDLASAQRTFIDNSASGATNRDLGASFLAASSTQSITFTANTMTGSILGQLQAKLPANEAIVSGWTLSTTNYTVSSTNPIYLSFEIDPAYASDDFEVWHYVSSSWTKCDAVDLTFDGTYASFTATGLSGYAITAVPEPGTAALLVAGLAGILISASRKRRGRKMGSKVESRGAAVG
jgi:T5SS/PEP-CTERM-associated repeat protein